MVSESSVDFIQAMHMEGNYWSLKCNFGLSQFVAGSFAGSIQVLRKNSTSSRKLAMFERFTFRLHIFPASGSLLQKGLSFIWNFELYNSILQPMQTLMSLIKEQIAIHVISCLLQWPKDEMLLLAMAHVISCD